MISGEPRAIIAAATMCVLMGCATAAPQTDRTADLEAFHDGMLTADQSFTDAARMNALEKFEALKKNAGRMSDAEFELSIAEIAALSENAHSTLYATHWASSYNRLAVQFYIADDGLFIANAATGQEDLLNARVETLEGKTLSELREIWDRYHNGKVGYQDQTLYSFIESPQILHAANVARSTDEVTLELDDGRKVSVGVTDEWPAPEGIWTVLPQAREIALAAADKITSDPLYLQEPEKFFRTQSLPDYDAMYIQFRANVDFSRQTDLYEASAKVQSELREDSPKFVIVDQRFNVGGDLNTTRDLMQALPDIVGDEGHVFVITSGRTFSAGISSVGYLKQAGGSKVTIIGAAVGDDLEFWAEGSPIELPQTGAYVGVSTERHNYQTGCPEDDCHGSIKRHPISVESLDPDIKPVRPYSKIMAGEDPYLDAVLKRIEEY